MWLRVLRSVFNLCCNCWTYVIVGPTLARDVPFSAVYWALYEESKRYLTSLFDRRDTRGASFLAPFLAGAGSGSIASLISNPFDVVKTRRQALAFGPESTSTPKKTYNTFSMMRVVVEEEGWSALMSGAAARVIRISLACSIMITAYETGKSYFRKRKMISDESIKA